MDYDGEMMTVMVTLSVSNAASWSWCKRTKTSKNNAHADVTVSKGMVILSKPTNIRFRRSQQTLGPGYYWKSPTTPLQLDWLWIGFDPLNSINAKQLTISRRFVSMFFPHRFFSVFPMVYILFSTTNLFWPSTASNSWQNWVNSAKCCNRQVVPPMFPVDCR